jgi:hypothetical protein
LRPDSAAPEQANLMPCNSFVPTLHFEHPTSHGGNGQNNAGTPTGDGASYIYLRTPFYTSVARWDSAKVDSVRGHLYMLAVIS